LPSQLPIDGSTAASFAMLRWHFEASERHLLSPVLPYY
jgi:hypothetical protein